MQTINDSDYINVSKFITGFKKACEAEVVYHPRFPDPLGDFYKHFRVLRDALIGNDTPAVREEVKRYSKQMLDRACVLLISDGELVNEHLLRLESLDVNVALVPTLGVDRYKLILESGGVNFTRNLVVRKLGSSFY